MQDKYGKGFHHEFLVLFFMFWVARDFAYQKINFYIFHSKLMTL